MNRCCVARQAVARRVGRVRGVSRTLVREMNFHPGCRIAVTSRSDSGVTLLRTSSVPVAGTGGHSVPTNVRTIARLFEASGLFVYSSDLFRISVGLLRSGRPLQMRSRLLYCT